MLIRVLSVGKLKERYLADAVAEYAKRLSRYCRLEFVSVEDEKTPDRGSEHEYDLIRQIEGQRLLKQIKEKDYCVALALDGKEYTSPQLASWLKNVMVRGNGVIDFVIGGSLGLSKEVLARADEKISFSKLTFPHQLMRVVLMEQIYRCFRILNNEPYHK